MEHAIESGVKLSVWWRDGSKLKFYSRSGEEPSLRWFWRGNVWLVNFRSSEG